MDLLNDIYRKSCEPKCESYTKIDDNIILIDNFFENFKSAKKFLQAEINGNAFHIKNSLNQGTKVFSPNWVGRSLMENFAQIIE